MSKTRHPRHPIGSALIWLGALLAFSCAPPPEPPPDGTPRLVVLIVVDQMRADYLTRFAHLYEGGLARLVAEGVVFTEAHHDHSATSTAPGHASLATGCHPSRHGVIGNYWFDRETGKRGYAVENDGPERLLCSTLGDWIKQRYPTARVHTASQKDRSAVMLGGEKADGAYWYDFEGGFTTSEYYTRDTPEWLAAFNEEKKVNELFGRAWTAEPLTPGEMALLGIDPTPLGPMDQDFPHGYGGAAFAPGDSFYRGLYTTPALDESLARLAVRAIYAESLGDDEIPDLLALGFSALDAVGHRYGPHSREVMETLLALDRSLGALLDELDQKIGLDQVVVALSSDHGVAPVPELRALRGESGGRTGVEQALCLQRIEGGLDERLGAADWLTPGGFLNPEALTAHEAESDTVSAMVRRMVEDCPGVARVWTRPDLGGAGADADEVRRRFANSFHGTRSPDFVIQWDEYFVPTRAANASHGTVYRYDTWVPLVVMAPGLGPAEVRAAVRTVDLAPTLARLVGVEPPDDIDGQDLSAYF